MDQSAPGKADSSSANEEISSILWISEAHYRIHNSPPLVPVLSQINPIYNTPFNCCNIHFNIKFPFKLRSSKWSLSLYPTRATCFAHLIFLDFYLPNIISTTIPVAISSLCIRSTPSAPPPLSLYLLFYTVLTVLGHI